MDSFRSTTCFPRASIIWTPHHMDSLRSTTCLPLYGLLQTTCCHLVNYNTIPIHTLPTPNTLLLEIISSLNIPSFLTIPTTLSYTFHVIPRPTYTYLITYQIPPREG